jgi:hypothetical protein
LDNNANDWLLMTLIDRCVSAGMVLADNQCYGYKIPPILGGKYTLENLEPTDRSIHYSFLADIYRQTRDLPNGAKVRVVVGSEPQQI